MSEQEHTSSETYCPPKNRVRLDSSMSMELDTDNSGTTKTMELQQTDIDTLEETKPDIVHQDNQNTGRTDEEGNQQESIQIGGNITKDATTALSNEDKSRKAHCEYCLLISYSNTIPATHLCFDCGIRVCAYHCGTQHQSHNLLNLDSKEDQREVFRSMLRNIEQEGDSRMTRFREEHLHISNIIDVIHQRTAEPIVVTGCTLLHRGSVAVVADFNNCCIKVLNLTSGRLVRIVKFKSRPFDVTLVPNGGDASTNSSIVAVTFPTKKEIFVVDISVKPAKIVDAHLVFDECFNIIFFKDQFVTLCYRHSRDTHHYLCFLHHSGLTINIVKLYLQVDRSLSTEAVPKIYFALHPTQDIIYISSLGDGSVVSFDYKGQVLNRFNFPFRQWPTGVCIGPDRHVYVSSFSWGHDASYVIRFSVDLKKEKTFKIAVPKMTDGLICYESKLLTGLRTLFDSEGGPCLVSDLMCVLQIE